MEEHQLLIVKWVNELLGPPFASLLSVFGVHVPAGQDVIPMQMIMGAIVVLVLMILSLIVRSRLSVENPGKLQQSMELAVEFLEGQLEENVGHDGHQVSSDHRHHWISSSPSPIFWDWYPDWVRRPAMPMFRPVVPSLFSCITTMPAFESTDVVKYLKHFVGPVRWMAPLMIPIELISHLARPLSLTIRLWGNIFAEELLIVIFVGIAAAVPSVAVYRICDIWRIASGIHFYHDVPDVSLDGGRHRRSLMFRSPLYA